MPAALLAPSQYASVNFWCRGHQDYVCNGYEVSSYDELSFSIYKFLLNLVKFKSYIENGCVCRLILFDCHWF